MHTTPTPPEDQSNTSDPFRLLSPSHKQCSWCGVRMDGPLAGYKAIDANGQVQKLWGYSHGICPPCREAWLASRPPAPSDAAR